jgi:N utilization substance protein A
MVGQLLATEGFASVEEIAYVESDEIADIEGFDEDTAEEIQARAREYLEEQERRLDDERKALGVADELKTIEGVTTPLLVALGKDGVKTIEDLAGCAADDLVGWVERKDGEESVRHEGSLTALGITREKAEAMIMASRLAAGWVTEEDLAPPAPEVEAEEGAARADATA